MQDAQAVRAEIAQLQAAAIQAQQAGKENEAGQLWARVLEFDASHGLALISLGKRAFRHGDLDRAQLAFERLVAAHPGHTQGWINLALTHQGRKDEAAEQSAIDSALRTDPHRPGRADPARQPAGTPGPAPQGRVGVRRGGHRGAAAGRAGAGPAGRRHHALQFRDRYDADFGSFLDGFLDNHYQAHGGRKPAALPRVGRHHGGAQAPLRIAVDDVPLSRPAADADPAARALSVARCDRGRHRRHPRRIPAGSRSRPRLHALPLPTRPTCRTTSSRN